MEQELVRRVDDFYSLREKILKNEVGFKCVECFLYSHVSHSSSFLLPSCLLPESITKKVNVGIGGFFAISSFQINKLLNESVVSSICLSRCIVLLIDYTFSQLTSPFLMSLLTHLMTVIFLSSNTFPANLQTLNVFICREPNCCPCMDCYFVSF